MKNNIWLNMLSVFIFVISMSCSDKIEPGNTPAARGPSVKVRVIEAGSTLQPVVYEAVGTVKAQLSATISSKLMGVIQAFRVKEGDLVKKDDLLVVIDERQVSAQLNQAQAALSEARKAEIGAVSAQAAAEAGAKKARLSYQRNQTMLAGEAITQEAFEDVEAQYKQAQAALAQAQAMVAAARSRIQQAQAMVDAAAVAQKDARVLAPFGGKITAKLADSGALASPGTPLLTLEREGGYRVDLVVPETYIQSVQTGHRVSVRIPAIGDATVEGRVDVIIPSADQGSRSFIVQVGLAATEALRSGMFARAPLVIGEKQTLRIPASAVVRQGQLTGVFIVDADQIARFRLVRMGRASGDQVDVISGIKEGARIIITPTTHLTNGSAVELEK